jgi:hypothetical protein
MRKYSDFFATLHDEQHETGDRFGRGTHYSVLRAIVFHDAEGAPLPKGKFCDFAVIWDEDHDDRVIEPIETIYFSGFLSSFLIFGERKGSFTAILSDDANDPSRRSFFEDRLNIITQHLDCGDAWPAELSSLKSDNNNPIINADLDKVVHYLANLKMLWRLGIKEPAARPKAKPNEASPQTDAT